MIDYLTNPLITPGVIIVAAFSLDLVAGDPAWMPHPVRWIGKLITLLDIHGRFGKSANMERLCGALMAVITVGATWGITYAILSIAERYSYPVFIIVSIYCVYACLAAKALRDEARAVVNSENIAEGRRRLSRIVGRDTANLGWPDIHKAVVETVAENTSDGIVAPLFFLAIGGPPLMMAYKAVNTLDSMVGYKNERYREFGWFSARMDDVANYIPARLAALIIAASAPFLGYNGLRSLKTLFQDGSNHPSPNSGRPEAAAAGALGCRLGGPSTYGGIVSDKPYIGQVIIKTDATTALGAIRLSSLTALFMLVLTVTGRTLIIILL